MHFELRLSRYDIAQGAALGLPQPEASIDAIYVVSGSLRLQSPGLQGAVGANSAIHPTAAMQITGSAPGTVALRWTLSRASATDSADLQASVALLKASLDLDPQQQYLLRCDRVDFPPQGVALRHTHQGGGIRCLLFGSIEINTKGARHAYAPLEAWFEAGPDPVFATASATEASAFVRVMILPRALLGKSSLSYVNAEDLEKPKNQRYQIFIDAPVDLPSATQGEE